MIDLHNHILVNLDDGPKNEEEAIRLLKQAVEEGVTGIIATPHHLNPMFNNEKQVVLEKIKELKNLEEIKKLNIDIYPAQEIRLSDQILPQLKEGKALSLNFSKYILIELPSNEVPHYTKNILFELQSLGYVPVIAHPERNKVISQNLDVLYDLVNNGALSQLTSSSLNGDLGKKIQKNSIQMIENNLVHFIASDAHHYENRPFIMNSLFKNKKLKNYKEEIEMLIKNSKLIIKNEDIKKYQPSKEYNNKKLFGIF